MILIVYIIFEISHFKVEKYNFKSKKIKNNIKILQVSDFHNSKWINKKRLLNEIEKFNPDFIFLTGDIISRRTKKFANIENLLDILNRYEVYFVEGNHKRDNKNKEEFYEILEKYKIKNISMKSYKREDLNIFGNKFNTCYDYNLVLEEDKYNILLTHDPKDFINSPFNYDLVFSGHTHGGQIRLPILGQVVDHGKSFFPEYSKGLYRVNKTDLLISSGLGQSVPIRILNRVSISEIEIKKEL